MVLTQKETMLLTDLKSQEQLCVEKYNKYSMQACDSVLKQLFSSIGQTEQQHLDSIDKMLQGTVPPTAGKAQSSPASAPESGKTAACDEALKKQDAYLCEDALGTEKHVSASYNVCIFEFSDAGMRDVLNHIQTEEQEHGKRIYDYMKANSMYN